MDKSLVLIGTVGALTLPMFRGFPGLVNLGGDNSNYAIGLLLCELCVIAGTITQTIFIVIALHRKPGKLGWISTASVASLIGLLNLSMWVTNTVDIEEVALRVYKQTTYDKITELQVERYDKYCFKLFLILCFPLAIFYRIHSAVVLYRLSKRYRNIPKEPKKATDISVKLQWQGLVARKRHLKKQIKELTKEARQVRTKWEEFEEQHRPLIEVYRQELTRDHKEFEEGLTELVTSISFPSAD